MNRATVDCSDPRWRELLRRQLESGGEPNLVHFHYASHGSQCELLAREFDEEFLLDRDPNTHSAQFRHKTGRV
jgi:hypothetical protein